jgi:hypothetical protein
MRHIPTCDARYRYSDSIRLRRVRMQNKAVALCFALLFERFLSCFFMASQVPDGDVMKLVLSLRDAAGVYACSLALLVVFMLLLLLLLSCRPVSTPAPAPLLVLDK